MTNTLIPKIIFATNYLGLIEHDQHRKQYVNANLLFQLYCG